MTGQGLPVHDLVLHSTGKGQVHTGGLVFKLWPQDTGRIQQVQAGVHIDPLLATGDAGLVARLGGLFLCHLVDKGGFAHVGHPHHHGPHRAAHQALGLPLLYLILQGGLDGGGKLIDSFPVPGVGLHDPPAFLTEPLPPHLIHSGVGLIRPVEDDEPGLLPHNLVDIRVAAGDGDAGVDDLRHQVYQLQIRLDLPSGFCHMAGIPLDIHLPASSVRLPCRSLRFNHHYTQDIVV